jgi:SNF2 family DNA or RNA helicase
VRNGKFGPPEAGASAQDDTAKRVCETFVTRPTELECPSCHKINVGPAQLAEVCRCSNAHVPVLTEIQCGHLYCRSCLDIYVAWEMEKGTEEPPCLRCKKFIRQSKNYTVELWLAEDVQAALDRQQALSISKPARKRKRKDCPATKPKGRGADFLNYEPREKAGRNLLHDSDSKPGTPLTMSAKLRGVVEAVEEWQKEGPNDKILSEFIVSLHRSPCHRYGYWHMIIVFTEWIQMAKVIGRKLQDMSLDFVYLIGNMNPGHKDKTVAAFHEEEDVKVMVRLCAFCFKKRFSKLMTP